MSVITIDPDRGFGRPCINGTTIHTERVAEVYMADGLTTACEDWDIDEATVWLALWFEGRYGGDKQLAKWAARHPEALDVKAPELDWP